MMRIKTFFLVASSTIALFLLVSRASGSIFSGWQPFKKPLDPAKKAAEQIAKLNGNTQGAKAAVAALPQSEQEKS